MKPDDLNDEELLYLVDTTDKELFDAGMGIAEREWEVPLLITKRLGIVTDVIMGPGAPPILERIRSTFASIYDKKDLAIGGHIGVYMYRDIFARINVPIVFGQAQIHLFKCVELTPIQLRMIQDEPEQIATYIDQFIDIFDVQYGINQLKSPYSKNELVRNFIGLARLQLHSASAILTGGFDHRGAVQSALLASELALKAGLAAQGLTEKHIKNEFGHKLSKAADAIGSSWDKLDIARIKRTLLKQPLYVPNRYSPEQPDRREVGHIVMGAQFIVAEIVRQMSDCDFRGDLGGASIRHYPV